MEDGVSSLGEWLQAKCTEERVSLRQVAIKTGVSHQTIAGLISGKKALPQTIKKLAKAFGNDHHHQTIALEDKLLVLAGYRTERPEEAHNEPLARILDKLNEFDFAQLGIVEEFTDFILKMNKQGEIKNDQ